LSFPKIATSALCSNRASKHCVLPMQRRHRCPRCDFFALVVFLILQNKLLLSHSQIEFYFPSLFSFSLHLQLSFFSLSFLSLFSPSLSLSSYFFLSELFSL
jgi:hypothetical protein